MELNFKFTELSFEDWGISVDYITDVDANDVLTQLPVHVKIDSNTYLREDDINEINEALKEQGVEVESFTVDLLLELNEDPRDFEHKLEELDYLPRVFDTEGYAKILNCKLLDATFKTKSDKDQMKILENRLNQVDFNNDNQYGYADSFTFTLWRQSLLSR